ncbi:lysin B [Mycobacterium phage FlagStaff]|uniref:Lysin B n=1 Tax=Mycobacterium phage FlagStaff TaxID=1647304 RepID=A0A0F6YRU3_9CAUD|nr:lysin B [Mycobacterium phage FlagStaff]AKF14464.1 lysin B [Mycobacterium phage FlagStaff]
MILKKGSSGPEVFRFYDYFTKWAKSYAFLLGRRDGYYGNDEDTFTRELQRRLQVPITGQFGDLEASRTGYRWTGTTEAPAPAPLLPIWHYNAPGSGATTFQGPAFQTAARAEREFRHHNQPIGYPMGGYLGLMGGPPDLSYNDVIHALDVELERLLWANPDVQDAMNRRRLDATAAVAVELWFEAYSQSADGIRRSVNRLFGDGGPFAMIRDRINGLILFGDPGTPKTGISRLTYPAWLERLVFEVNYANDFYAIAPDNIRPAMFGIIVEAEMELPFFVHVLRLAARIIPDWLTFLPIGGMLGGLGGLMGKGGPFGTLATLSVGAMTGLGGNPALGQLMGMAGGGQDQEVDDKLYELLRPTGILSNIGGLIQLVGALPGLQAHGGYEFDPAKMDEAFGHIARFRR